MDSHYRIIVIGGTFCGCGIAAVAPGSIVFEESNQVGSDFVFSFDPGTRWDFRPEHAWAREFKEELLAGSFLDGGRIQMGALAPLLSKWCLRHGVDVELLSNVTLKNSNVALVSSPAGERELSADLIVDARPRLSDRKWVTALVRHPESPSERRRSGRMEIIPGRFDDESYLLMELPGATSWMEARRLMHEAWLARSEEFREWRMVLVGARFSLRDFENPLVALDSGLREGCR
jgi:hypothetical protein